MVAWWIGLRLPTSPLFQGFLKLVRDGISKEASQELIRCFASIRIRLPASVWSVDSPHHHRIWPSSQVVHLRLQALPIFSPAGWPVIYSKNNLTSVIFDVVLGWIFWRPHTFLSMTPNYCVHAFFSSFNFLEHSTYYFFATLIINHFHLVLEMSNICHGFSGSSGGKESARNAGDPGSIHVLGRPPGGGHGNPLQYSYLENSMNRGDWWATVHGIQRVGHDSSDLACMQHLSLFLLKL